jgi:hypothetical protein
MEDEFSYPQHVQDAIDFVERETKAARRQEIDAEISRRRSRGSRRTRDERTARKAERQREADSDAKFWEARRQQQAAQQAKKRFQPAQPEGWVRP